MALHGRAPFARFCCVREQVRLHRYASCRALL